MIPIDWFALFHPVLMILFVYPVVGATVRLATLARERRLDIHPLPPTVGIEHADHGSWATTGTLVAVVVALLWSFVRHGDGPDPSLQGHGSRLLAMLPLAVATLCTGVSLWWLRRSALRGAFALLCWAGLLVLGLQPEVWRLSDNPLESGFWASHFWGGWLLLGLMLFSVAARHEIEHRPAMRRWHVAAALLMALLLAVQAITGTRDLQRMVSVGSPVNGAPGLEVVEFEGTEHSTLTYAYKTQRWDLRSRQFVDARLRVSEFLNAQLRGAR